MSFQGNDAERYARYISLIADGTVLRINVEKLVATRSLKQNAYYHGVVVDMLRQYLGIETAEAMHEVLKHLHLTESIRLPSDRRKKIEIVGSTTDLTPMEFEEYLEDIRKWAWTKLRFHIPKPNEIPLYAYSICDL